MPLYTMIGYGEFFDKLSILINKFHHCKKHQDVATVASELIRLLESTPTDGTSLHDKVAIRIRKLDSNVGNAIQELRDFNKKLWLLEEEVRNTSDAQERDKISTKIREFNWLRSEAKKYIDELFNEDIVEVKDYGTQPEE